MLITAQRTRDWKLCSKRNPEACLVRLCGLVFNRQRAAFAHLCTIRAALGFGLEHEVAGKTHDEGTTNITKEMNELLEKQPAWFQQRLREVVDRNQKEIFLVSFTFSSTSSKAIMYVILLSIPKQWNLKLNHR